MAVGLRRVLIAGLLVLSAPVWAAKKVDLDYHVRLLPQSDQAEVRVSLSKGSAVRSLNFDLGSDGDYSDFKADGQWNDRRVILFTEYRTTHQWMHEILASHDFGGDRLAILHGGIAQDEREKVKAAFQTSPKDSAVRILLATDAASEGIDLQNHCNCLIHLEIPYNPNVMEQRNGRIDRHGQRQPRVHIFHFVGQGYHRRARAAQDANPGDLEEVHAVFLGQGGYLPLRVRAFLEGKAEKVKKK